ncbi:MAG TPA: DMT family transporter [Bacteroidetes bacterium]|nr:DMT family transporter [Bacteroidota bacterium]
MQGAPSMSEQRPSPSGKPAAAGYPRRRFATVMLVLLTVVWGMTFPATKSALADTEPMHFLALRFLFALALLLPYTLLQRRRPRSIPVGRITGAGAAPGEKTAARPVMSSPWVRGGLVGLLLGLGFALQVLGLRWTTASRSGFFTGLLVVLVPPLAALLRTSHAPRLTWLALAPATLGIYLIADPEAGGLNLGDWLTIGCAVVFALQMVTLEALAWGRRETLILTTAQVIVVAGGALAWSLLAGKPLHLTPTGWLAVAYTALFGTVLAVWMQTRFQPEVPAGHAALVFTLEPVFAGLFAWLLLGEGWTLRGLVGAGFILASMTLSSLAVARRG